MSLKDKEIRWYPVSKTKPKNLATHNDKPHVMSKDIKEVVLQYEKFIKESLIEERSRIIINDFRKIFGDWEK